MTALEQHCATCRWARPMPNGDLTHRVCYGGPPQAVWSPQGVALHRPNVEVGEFACAAYAPRLLVSARSEEV
jgi:hypothetical protein